MSFQTLGVNDFFITQLKNQYINEPTAIQKVAIPALLSGQSVIAESETGTGKTLAFVLPVLQQMDLKAGLQTLIIAPTRELAIQITEAIEKLETEFKVLSIFGGRDIQSQMKKLNKDVHIVVATPGRLLDHIKRQTINFKQLRHFILDEVDQLLDMGFRDDIFTILKTCPKKMQMIGFSATVNPAVKKLAYRLIDSPQFISAKMAETPVDQIKQYAIITKPRNKQADFIELTQNIQPFMAIVFCRTRRRVDQLEMALHQQGFNCTKLHGGMPQSKRQKAIKAFKSLSIQYLIATEVASRGLDISGVTHVFNYDIPENSESYIHRIGRTGRAKEDGVTYVFVNEDEVNQLQVIEKDIQCEIEKIRLGEA